MRARPGHIRSQARREGLFKPHPGFAGRLWGLTRREVESLEAVIVHGRAKIAAEALGLSIKTLEVHMQNVREKVGVNHVAPLVAAYLTAKWAAELKETQQLHASALAAPLIGGTP